MTNPHADLIARSKKGQPMQIEIKPLVWKTHCRETGGCSAQSLCGEYILETDEPGGEFGMWVPGQGEGSETDFYFSSLEATQAAANAHHAVYVRSRVAGVSLSHDDGECAMPNLSDEWHLDAHTPNTNPWLITKDELLRMMQTDCGWWLFHEYDNVRAVLDLVSEGKVVLDHKWNNRHDGMVTSLRARVMSIAAMGMDAANNPAPEK